MNFEIKKEAETFPTSICRNCGNTSEWITIRTRGLPDAEYLPFICNISDPLNFIKTPPRVVQLPWLKDYITVNCYWAVRYLMVFYQFNRLATVSISSFGS